MKSAGNEETPKLLVYSEMRDKLDQYRRIILIGGTGGAIALLSFLGSSLASDLAAPLLRPMWWCLLAFVLSITMCLLDRVAEIRALGARLELPEHLMTRAINKLPRDDGGDVEVTLDEELTSEVHEAIKEIRAAFALQLIVLSIASACNVAGVSGGLWILFRLTAS